MQCWSEGCLLISYREFLVNPFLFMTAAVVEAEPQEHGGYNAVPGVQIIGQNVSSLHRLKDISNDGELHPAFHTLSLLLNV